MFRLGGDKNNFKKFFKQQKLVSMKYLFELSKEHKTLPTAEVLSCLKAEDILYNVIESNEDVLVIESKNMTDYKIKRLADRLSMTFFVDKLLFSSPPSIDEIRRHASKHRIEEDGSIEIRCNNRSKTVDSQKIIRELGEIYSRDRTVDLTKPDLTLRVSVTKLRVYVGLKKAEINRSQFEERKVQYRPFFSPISLHPRLARTLVNLSMIKRDEILLDPFCGTGGILIEAGLIGAETIGGDIDDRMIEGCRQNLDHYRLRDYRLFCCDIGDIIKYVGQVDAVVTDLPYGKSTTTKGEDIKQLYRRAFKNISMMLKRGGRAVIGLSNRDMMVLGCQCFSLVEYHVFRVHRSLTRYFAVYQN
ncbi:MAG: hypothetical protein DRN08_02565 [Thermoplasmata archaeon]|nr:MAG: hypothetical protein DRN05_00605 [Thermoplasmata archaeon]RLF35735.1 MAG: hypothetical protein DRN08_02565 [Thermoplasmata archaeon]